MRGDWSSGRGEAGRVAERVRLLLDGSEWESDPESEFAEAPVTTDSEAGRGRWMRVLWRRLAARVPVRLDPGHRAALGVGVAVGLAAVVTGIWLMSSRPEAVPVSARVPSVPGSSLVGTGAPGGSAATTSRSTASAARASASVSASGSAVAPPSVVVVDVAGKVTHPGLYRLPVDSRVNDALKAAGGARRGVDLSTLNLAAKVADGEQIAVGVPPAFGGGVAGGSAGGGAVGGASSAAGAGGTPGTPVDLNTASLDQLDALPGVGPVLAQHILDWRTAHGQFASVDQLNDVSGIGDVKFAGLRDLVSV